MSIFSCAKETSPAPCQFIEWDLKQVQGKVSNQKIVSSGNVFFFQFLSTIQKISKKRKREGYIQNEKFRTNSVLNTQFFVHKFFVSENF